MGGDDTVGAQESDAKLVGAFLTEAQNILLTGGRCIEQRGVKNAAMLGARERSQKTAPARLIGILPDDRPREWDETQDHSLFLWTGLNHRERDAINGITPDALIFFAGSSGTLCELAFALHAPKAVLFWRATQILQNKFKEHFEDGEVDSYLSSALAACKTKLGSVSGVDSDTPVSALRATLSRGLASAEDFRGEIRDLVAESIRRANNPSGASGFPGFREERNSKERFELIVERISA
jgi:predicted Rossmann-fold nucleotide-binding protein